jgi:hypothetical protein
MCCFCYLLLAAETAGAGAEPGQHVVAVVGRRQKQREMEGEVEDQPAPLRVDSSSRWLRGQPQVWWQRERKQCPSSCAPFASSPNPCPPSCAFAVQVVMGPATRFCQTIQQPHPTAPVQCEQEPGFETKTVKKKHCFLVFATTFRAQTFAF